MGNLDYRNPLDELDVTGEGMRIFSHVYPKLNEVEDRPFIVSAIVECILVGDAEYRCVTKRALRCITEKIVSLFDHRIEIIVFGMRVESRFERVPITDEYRIAYPDHRPSAGVSPVVTGLALQYEDKYRVSNQSIEDQSHRSGKTFLAINGEDGRAMCAVLPMAASNIDRSRVSPKMIAKVDVQVLTIEPEPLDQRL